jgi:phage terminase large subunit-like protein
MLIAEIARKRLPLLEAPDYYPRDGESCADWAQRCFYIPELKGPIVLYPYQQQVLREAARRDDEGQYIYNTVVWGDIKKSAKSTIAAVVALYRGLSTRWGSIKIVANDLKQADSRVAYYLRRAVSLNPQMASDIKQVQYKTTLPNKTTIEAIPIDPGGEAGGNDDLIIFSELWAAKHKAISQMWTEMTLSPTKFGHSQRWIETYAGYTGESPILEQLYERCVKNGQRLDSDLELYANGSTLCLWNTTPRLPWQTQEYYNSEQEILLPSEFRRVHRNEWGSGTEKFVNIVWWDNCQEQLPPLTGRESVVLALDAAKGSESVGYIADTFSVVGVTRHPGRPKDVAVRYCGIWQPDQGQLLDFDPIENEIKRLCKEYNVVEVTYDPTQLHYLCNNHLGKMGLTLFKEFSQGPDRIKADKQLQTLITNRRIAHDGNPLLRQHIDNASVKKYGDGTSSEDGVRVIKAASNKKVDAAVALSMAASRILYYNIG